MLHHHGTGYAIKYCWNINNTSLYISGKTILNNTTTCMSSLNVSGTTTLLNNVDIGTSSPGYMLDVYTDNTSIIIQFVLEQIQHVKQLQF